MLDVAVFGPAVRSPEVDAQGGVTFRLAAPGARHVEVELHAALPRLVLQRDASGLWQGRCAPLPADLYGYCFIVDGVALLDPSNALVKRAHHGLGESLVEVPALPGAAVPPWLRAALPGAPRGRVVRHSYPSALLAQERTFHVYVPAAPAVAWLVLAHGAGDDAAGWFDAGRADVILDHLIASGQCAPCVVVAPGGFCDPRLSGQGRPPPGAMQHNVERYAQVLLDEVLPQVEQAYALPQGARGAIAGLSMGGAQALYAGLRHPERFAAVAAFSPAVMMLEAGPAACLPVSTSMSMSLASLTPSLTIECGRDDAFFEPVCRFVEALRPLRGALAPPLQWQARPGGHHWSVWRAGLVDFLRGWTVP